MFCCLDLLIVFVFCNCLARNKGENKKSFPTLTYPPTGEPDLACDLPALLGLPDGLFPLL